MHLSPLCVRTARATVVLGAAAATLFGLTVTATAAPDTGHGAVRAAAATPAPTTRHPVAKLCGAPARKGFAACFAERRTDVAQPHRSPDSTAAAVPSGYGPSDLLSAYKLGSGGSGATVGIVDAQDNPNAESDLAKYRSQYGLPACTTANGCFTKVNQSGTGSPLPTADAGWAGEIALDLDMVSAVCPSCHILLVEATSASIANLGASVNTAVRLGAKYVSNSYGGSEDSSVTSADSSYFNHPGVAITASTGDNGYDGGSYPATSKYVTAVGGTSLSKASNSRGWSETAWSDAGSGCSKYIAKPAFQTSLSTGCSKRAEADVSAVADPNTGVAVYNSYQASGWAVYGGTSASSPIIASVYALAGTPGASDVPNSYPYAHTGNLFDVTSGSNGSCGAPLCTAGAGYDGPTGLGSPNGTAAFKAGGSTGGGGGGTGTCSGQVLGNPGFESGATTWTQSSGVIDNSTDAPAHSGSYKAWLDGYGSAHTDSLSQTVTVPSGCRATLTFWVYITTQETGSTAYDRLSVKAGSTTLATYSNANASSGYVQKSLTVSATGSVTITFTGTEDSSAATSFLIDDTALTLS